MFNRNQVTYWEKRGAKIARDDPENWPEILNHEAEVYRLNNEPLIVKKTMEGRAAELRVQEITEHLNAAGGEPAMQAVHARLLSSVFHFVAAAGLFATTFVLLLWAFAPFRLQPHIAYAAAAATAVAGMVLFKILFDGITQRFPESDVSLWTIFLSVAGLVLLFAAIYMFAMLRGFQLGVPGSVDIANEAANFYKVGRQYISMGFVMIAFCAEIGGALCFLAGQTSFSSARPFFRMNQERNKKKREMQRLGVEITELKNAPGIIIQAGSAGAMKEIAKMRRSDPQAEERGRFFRNLFIFVLVILLLLVCMGRAMGCETSVILVDLTLSSNSRDLAGTTAFEMNMRAVEKMISETGPGTLVVVAGIHGQSFTQPFILLRAQTNKDPGYFNEIAHSDRKKMLSEWKKARDGLKPVAKNSDYLGAFRLAADIMQGNSSSGRCLSVFGDMLQATRQVNLETAKTIDEKFIKNAMARLRMPELRGVSVRVYGAGGRDEAHFENVKMFWAAYFKAAGARLERYSSLREVHNE
jgi:hypothetical protein